MTSRVFVTTPSDREIKVTRSFDAPAEVVFDFHTKPEHLKQWLLGPPGWSMPTCELDLRSGGRYRYVWSNDESGAEFGVQGTFYEIDAPSRIVHTETMDGRPGEALCTLTLSEAAGSTTLSLTMQFDSKAERDAALESGMTDGISISYERLEESMTVHGGS